MKIEEGREHEYVAKLTDSFWQLISDRMKSFSHVWERRFGIVIGWRNFPYGFFMWSILFENLNKYIIWNNKIF